MTRSILATSALALVLGASLATAAPGARVGEAAPVFTLNDVAGAPQSLAQHAGKVVVLEWFNPDCPAVKKHHQQAKTMKELAAKYRDRGVVWLAINSGAPGKQGTGAERNQRAVSEYQIEYPVLLDPTGATGRAYGAQVTPTMVVVDAQGKVAYFGAIDDNRGGTNYVDKALEALLDGAPVGQPETRAYG
jgi:peroxiredoxin